MSPGDPVALFDYSFAPMAPQDGSGSARRTMAEFLGRIMAERRAKAARLRDAGHNPYRNDIKPTHTLRRALRARYEPTRPSGDAAGQGGGITPVDGEVVLLAGRAVARRGLGKTVFLPIRDGFRRPAAVPQRGPSRPGRLRGGAARARRGRHGRRRGHCVLDQDAASCRCCASRDLAADQVAAPAAGEVARPDRRRDPLSPALPRPGGQPGGARGVPQALAPGLRRAPLLRRPRLPRGRDADDAPGHRRRRGAPVHHPPQRARPAPVHAHRAGAVPQAPGGRRLRAGLRDRPQLPQRGAVAHAQPRVHDARVLLGLRDLPGSDDADRGAGRRAGPRRGRQRCSARATAPPSTSRRRGAA